jgi:hypothetical protein
MKQVKVEFEGNFDEGVDDLLSEIEEIDTRIHQYVGSHYVISYFYAPYNMSFWRFDWGYLWDRTDSDLRILLKKACEFGRSV